MANTNAIRTFSPTPNLPATSHEEDDYAPVNQLEILHTVSQHSHNSRQSHHSHSTHNSKHSKHSKQSPRGVLSISNRSSNGAHSQHSNGVHSRINHFQQQQQHRVLNKQASAPSAHSLNASNMSIP